MSMPRLFAEPTTAAAHEDWWSSLRHLGLLLAPSEVAAVETALPLVPLSAYRADELRRLINQRDAGEIEPGRFVTMVLERTVGLGAPDEGSWLRHPNVPAEFTQVLITGQTYRPRHVWTGPHGAQLPVFLDDSTVLGAHGGRRAVSQVLQWLRAQGRSLALLTNTRQWRLLYAGLDFDAAVEWTTDLWFDQGHPGPQLGAFRRLLSSKLLDAPERGATSRFVAHIESSRRGQSELSASLGERVRECVETLVRAHGAVLDPAQLDVSGAEIYRAAVRVIMRLVVVLFAESRDLLPRDNPVYHLSYGLSALYEQLQRVGPRSGRLRHRHGAWPRILALFRLIHRGSHHEALPIPAYGGDLFAPGLPDADEPLSRALHVFESGCFQPGRELMSDQVIFDMLELLTRTRVRVRQGRSTTTTIMPVDFSDLSSEYIGILYEGLLDYELRTAPADDAIVFLSVGDQPALPLSRLESMDDAAIAELFKSFKQKDSGADDAPEEGAEGEETDDDAPDADADTDAAEVDSDASESSASETGALERARERAAAWATRACLAARMVARPRGRMTPEQQLAFEGRVAAAARTVWSRIVPPGEWYLVRWGGTRKGSGTFYTRPQLAVPTVHRTLRPLAYEPPAGADGQPDADAAPGAWRPKEPERILGLAVCDPACGSGSFLVASLRYLTDALYASLFAHGRFEGQADKTLVRLLGTDPSVDETGLGAEWIPERSDGPAFEPRLKARLRRHVVERCLYGVDLDPLAVELCRLALWIETMDRELPFSFLDHKVKAGNSLIGCWLDRFQHYPVAAWNREGGDKSYTNGTAAFPVGAWTTMIKTARKDRVIPELARHIVGRTLFDADTHVHAIATHDRAVEALTRLHELPVHDAAERSRLYRDLVASRDWCELKGALDLWCATWFWPADEIDRVPMPASFRQPGEETRRISARIARRMNFFHWELEFPEVFRTGRSGFDAVVGNPPWDTAKPNSREFFSNVDPLYRTYGKQEALQYQTRYFAASRDVERGWLEYNATFKAQSNFVGAAAAPFGDPDDPAGENMSLARGNENKRLHALWRDARGRTRGFADPAHPFRYQGSADLNLYKLFVEQAHALLHADGRLGFIIPSGLYSDNGSRALRELFLDRCRWEWLFGFENRDKVFDIDSRFKFNPIIVQKGGTTDAIRAAFMRRRLEDWESAEHHATPYARGRVERFSPRSRSLLEIQSDRDLEILEKIYANSVLLGDDSPDGWGIKYATEFHMTNDSKLFPPRPAWEAKGYKPDEYSRWLLGKWRPREAGCPAPPGMRRVETPAGVILSRDGTEWIEENAIVGIALPLYQGVMMGQLLPNRAGWGTTAGARRWEKSDECLTEVNAKYLIDRTDVDQLVPDALAPRYLLRNIARTTDSRTLIGTPSLPFPAGHSLAAIASSQADQMSLWALGGILSSFAFDWQLRRRLAGTNVSLAFLEETAVPRWNGQIVPLAGLVLSAAGTLRLFSPEWLRLRATLGLHRPLSTHWALTPARRSEVIAMIDSVVLAAYGATNTDVRNVFRECDLPIEVLSRRGIDTVLNPIDFWRVDKRRHPEQRQTVLAMLAFEDLERKIQASAGDFAKGVAAYLSQNDGDGWILPEFVRLADHDLGADSRATVPQPVRSRFGPRYLGWQMAEGPAESWQECELHARNLLGESGYKKLKSELAGEPSARSGSQGTLFCNPRPTQGSLFEPHD